MITALNHGIIKTLILGTAMWGWSLESGDCFRLLDNFYAAGFRQVDTATNYPINRNPEDFRAAEGILLSWIQAHGIADLEVMIKVGSINNLRTPEHNLSKSFLLLSLDDYAHRFGPNLHTLMIHWDNRAEEIPIRESLEVLAQAAAVGVRPGLSGIRRSEIYRRLNQDFNLDFRIQVKHNILQSDIERYTGFRDAPRFLAYGLNAGGLKLNPEAYSDKSTLALRGGTGLPTDALERIHQQLNAWNSWELPQPIRSFNQLGLINAYHHPLISGLILGPSRSEQLADSLAFFRALEQYPVYGRIYDHLRSLL